MDNPRILHLTLKKKWFDMILSGEKTEEYREMKPYWRERLVVPDSYESDTGHLLYKFGAVGDTVVFRNGYSANAPEMTVELIQISERKGKEEWGAMQGVKYYVIQLGKILLTKNI